VNPVFPVPDIVRNKALAASAERWLDELPGLVASLELAWGFTVGRPFQDATEAFVAPVLCTDGSSAVLKLIVPGREDAARHEIKVLELADGHGCVRLLRSDVARAALLLERLGPSLHDLGLPLERRQRILCASAASLWRPAPDAGLPTGIAKGRWLIEFITRTWEDLDRPCSERAIAHALDCAERRVAAHDDERAVLVHGDLHAWNALQADDGFKLIDPDGLHAEAEYDLGVMMRQDPIELLQGDPFARARWLAHLTGLDATAIWEWGVAERVSTGLLCARIGLQPVGRQMLHAAERIAASEA
jgi:streptomycin 6-kinase